MTGNGNETGQELDVKVRVAPHCPMDAANDPRLQAQETNCSKQGEQTPTARAAEGRGSMKSPAQGSDGGRMRDGMD